MGLEIQGPKLSPKVGVDHIIQLVSNIATVIEANFAGFSGLFSDSGKCFRHKSPFITSG